MIFDLNFKYSYKYLRENNLIEKLWDRIKNKEMFKEYFEFINKYIDENNVNNTDTVTYPEYVIVQGGHTAIELFELILIMIIIVVIIVVVIYGVDRLSLKRPCDMVDM